MESQLSFLTVLEEEMEWTWRNRMERLFSFISPS
jgi:hypothetical protein